MRAGDCATCTVSDQCNERLQHSVAITDCGGSFGARKCSLLLPDAEVERMTVAG